MTDRPAFGDFLMAARGHVRAAVAGHQADRSGEHVQEVSDSLLHVITATSRYLQDIAAIPGDMPSGASPPLTAWGHARLSAREALTHATRHLRQHTWITRAPGVAVRSELARQLDAAAVALTAGRDLLHTHLAQDLRGARQFRSEWGLVVCSPPAERALLAELAWLAHQIAGPCTDVALAGRSPDTAGAKRGLRSACTWLQALSGSAQAAHRAAPVSAADRDLLLAIPVNAPLPRPVLDGSEPVTALYDAVITSAERARHAAWVTGSQPAWSPHLTADSLRHVAATSTVTSHHCEILLRSLAARTDGDAAGLSASLQRAADAAGRARGGWLQLARALNQVDTDTMRHLAPTSGEPGDLALCTGRLAYADPAWTLSSGPGHQPRPPQELAPQPGDVVLALAAAHHACDAVTSLAYAQRERVRTAASAGRLLVPTRSLPDTMDVPRPFGPALPDHVYALLRLCQDTAEASAEASAQAGEAAVAVRAPSRVLTAARAAARAVHDASTSPQSPAPELAVTGHFREDAGAVQAALRRLGVSSPDLLQRAADMDRASEQLILEAARRPQQPADGYQHESPEAEH